MLRAAMLHRFGVSLRLPELRPSLRRRLAAHVALYREHVAPFVRDGVLLPLTPPPERGGLGERAPVAQLIAPADDAGAGDRHLVAAFVLPGGTRPDRVRPRRLDAGRSYRVTDLATGASRIARAADARRRHPARRARPRDLVAHRSRPRGRLTTARRIPMHDDRERTRGTAAPVRARPPRPRDPPGRPARSR